MTMSENWTYQIRRMRHHTFLLLSEYSSMRESNEDCPLSIANTELALQRPDDVLRFFALTSGQQLRNDGDFLIL